MWWSAQSPPSGWYSNWKRRSPPPVDRRGCCGWTTARKWFLKRCNGSARTRPDCSTFRRAVRGTTATSNRSTTDSGRSASTATTGTACSRPAWSSATSRRPQPPTPALGPGLPDAGRVRCRMQVHPYPGGLRDQLNLDHTNSTLRPGGLGIGDSPGRHRIESASRSSGSWRGRRVGRQPLLPTGLQPL